MRRGYTAREYLGRVHVLRAAVLDVSITTDPSPGSRRDGEGLRADLSLVREAAFDAAFTFVYSPRTGTAAAGLPDRCRRRYAASAWSA